MHSSPGLAFAALGLVEFAVACGLSAALTGIVLRVARAINARQIVRDDGPEAHLKKQGTPSIGGLGILVSFVVVTLATLPWLVSVGIGAFETLWIVGITVGFAAIGFYDDYCKFALGRKEGWKARYRIIAQVILAGIFVYFALYGRLMSWEPSQWLGTGFGLMGLGIEAWCVASAIVLIGSVNAVNFTDGLDGLAGGLTAICGIFLAIALFVLGQAPLGVVALGLAGAALGFLWLNSHPASIFMGDVGSYALGGALGAIALLAHVELLYAVMGFVFVAEALSVIMQVASFRATGKRIFRMAPLHHHFELNGWPETKIVARFYIIGTLCGLGGLILVLATR